MSAELISITIDGVATQVEQGQSVLDAARKAGVDIPTLCWLPRHEAWPSCLVCAVQIEGQNRLVPSCATVAQPGMVVHTDSEKVARQRKTALELLLSDHMGECLGPCQTTCPAHLDIPAMNLAVVEGRLEDAAKIVKDTIPLGASLGRICPAPCEGRCRRKPIDGAVSVCMLKRYVVDKEIESGQPWVPPVATPTGKRVAILGTGPTGLTAAYFLLRMGHACTLYDDHEEPGGALRYAVPETRLPREVLDAEIDVIRKMGAVFVLGQRANLAEVRGTADAVLLAVGPVTPEEVLDGVSFATRGILAKKRSWETNQKGVFAAGAAVAPGKISVRSISDGHSVADSIHRFFGGKPMAELAYNHPTDKNDVKYVAARLPLAASTPRVEPESGGFSDAEAYVAADRCLRCACAKLDSCSLRELAEKFGANPKHFAGTPRETKIDDSHPDVILDEGKCISCGICIRLAADYHEALGMSFKGRGFDTRVGGPMGQPLAEALRVAGIAAAEACPTGALSVRKKDHAH